MQGLELMFRIVTYEKKSNWKFFNLTSLVPASKSGDLGTKEWSLLPCLFMRQMLLTVLHDWLTEPHVSMPWCEWTEASASKFWCRSTHALKLTIAHKLAHVTPYRTCTCTQAEEPIFRGYLRCAISPPTDRNEVPAWIVLLGTLFLTVISRGL
jgi:hypothetical protein